MNVHIASWVAWLAIDRGSLLVKRGTFQCCDKQLNLVTCERPAFEREIDDDCAFEVLVELQGAFIISQVICKKCQGKLCRTAAAVSPFTPAHTVIPQAAPGTERPS